MPLRLRVFAVLSVGLAGLAARPLPARAQGGEARTVTVKRGDTLWDLAKQHLGDAFLWPEIYRLNTGLIEDPHWIYPGQQLRLSDTPVATPAPAAPVAPPTPAPAAPVAPPTPAPAAPVAAPAPPAPEPVPAPRQAAPRQSRGMTVFNPAFNRPKKTSRESLILGARQVALRSGEYIASPFMWAPGGPTDGGYIQSSADIPGIDLTMDLRPIQSREQVFVVLPRGVQGVSGERFLVYRLGPVIAGQGQVVIPTGIVKVVDPRADGRARAELVQKFEDVFTGQHATLLDTLGLPVGKFPQRVEFGLATSVSWLYNEPVLPTTGQYLILSAGAKEGLAPGDQLSLRRDRPTPAQGMPLPDEEVAVAQVTRVTPWGASAIVVMQDQAGIIEGMRARVTAKMP